MRLAVLTVAALAAALSASAHSSSPPTVTCDSIIAPVGSYSWRPSRVVLGVVAVPPRHIPQTLASGVKRWPYWSKSGLVVRADSLPVTITVPRRWRDRVAIGWGNVDAGSTLRVASCSALSSLGDWNPYSGGFYLRSRTACVALTFRVGNRSATVRFGLGRRCR